jgi:hypothetical protein
MGSSSQTKNSLGTEEVIQFASGLWTSAEQNYSALEKEIKAALNAIYKFELYLIYKKFILRTDAAAMNKVLHKELKNPGDHKFARWQALFSNFDFSIEYLKGSANALADFLSREHLQVVLSSFIVSIQLRDNQEHIENIPDRLPWDDYIQLWTPRWGLRSTQVISQATNVLYYTLVPEVRRMNSPNLLAPIIQQHSQQAVAARQHLVEWFHDINAIWQKENTEKKNSILH